MRGRTATLSLVIAATLAATAFATQDDGGGFPQDPLSAPARRPVPAPGPARKAPKRAAAKARPRAAQPARARAHAMNPDAGLDFVAAPIGPVMPLGNGAVAPNGMVVPGDFHGNFNTFGGNVYTNGLGTSPFGGAGTFGTPILSGFGPATIGGFPGSGLGGLPYAGTGGFYAGGYGGGVLPYYAAGLGLTSSGFGPPLATNPAPLAGSIDSRLIHGYDGDEPDFRPSNGVVGGNPFHPRIETVRGGSRIDGYGVALRKGERVQGGNLIAGYGVIGSSDASAYNSYASGYGVQGGTYVPGFGVMGHGAGIDGNGLLGPGYAAGTAVQGGSYVPGFSVTVDPTSHAASVAGQAVNGGTLVPGFGVLKR